MTRSARTGPITGCAVALACALALPFHAAMAASPTGLHVASRIAGPDGGWDYASFDLARHRVYVAHGNMVLAIDALTGALNPTFAAGNHLHAILPVPGTDRLVTTNSGDHTARIISAVNGALLASIPTAEDTDGARYDPKTGLVVVICGDGGALTLIDPKAMKAVGEVKIGQALEFGAPDGTGRFFVNVEAKNQIAVVDLVKRVEIARYDLPGCEQPTGLAYVEGHRVVADCGNGGVDILDANTGKAIATFKVGGFPDAVIYDEVRHLAYIPSARSGAMSVIALDGPANNTIIETIPTQIGARTGTVDPATGRVYLPTAEYLPPAAPGQRPGIKPGSFVILVLDR